MIVKLSGRLVEKRENSLVVDVNGLFYEVFVPLSVMQRVDGKVDDQGRVELITYHYIQIGPSSGAPILVGFLSEVEKDFFQQFIKVSGIGPRAAVKALNRPISEISCAINEGDHKFLKTLPGIGMQKAKEIVAKLQGKVGKYGLIQDRGVRPAAESSSIMPDWQKEAMDVLLQLQYRRQEAIGMIEAAVGRSDEIATAEELLNEIYKQRSSS